MNGSAESINHQNYLSVFFLLLAAMDYSGLIDYAAKAFIGGLILLVFRIMGDVILEKVKEIKKSKKEND